MTCRIPSGTVTELLSCWKSLTDQSYEIFGVECDLIYLEKRIVTTKVPSSNNPTINTINSGRRNMPDSYDNVETVTEQEVSEKIILKIYWDSEKWYKVFGYSSVPENSVLILCKMEDARRVNKAIRLRFTDESGAKHVLVRDSKVLPWGFEKKEYGSSIWKQEE